MNKVVNEVSKLLILSLVLISCQISSQTLQDSLLIHYKFDGDSLDYCGNGYNPILFRATYADDIAGNPNSALYFDGVDDLIIIPDIQELKPDFPITISFWLKMDNLSAENNVYYTNDFYRFSHSGVWLNLSSSQRMALSYGNGNGFYPSARRSKLTNMTLQSDEWYFVAGVILDINDLRIYIDGIEEFGYIEGSADYLSYVGTGGNIGRKDANYQTDPYFYKGYFDDFRYWNRGLSSDEILNLYDEVVGITNSSVDKLVSIYPNPASDYINVKTDIFKTGELKVEIHNILGEIILNTVSDNKIDIRHLQKGIYFVHINNIGNTNSTKTFKFIKD